VAVNDKVVTVAWDTALQARPTAAPSRGPSGRTAPRSGARSRIRLPAGASGPGSRGSQRQAPHRAAARQRDGDSAHGERDVRAGPAATGIDTTDPERRLAVLPNGTSAVASREGGGSSDCPPPVRAGRSTGRFVRANPRLHAAETAAGRSGDGPTGPVRMRQRDGAGKASLLRTGKQGERLTSFAADREGGDPYDSPSSSASRWRFRDGRGARHDALRPTAQPGRLRADPDRQAGPRRQDHEETRSFDNLGTSTTPSPARAARSGC
jgi:hypothetical protein